MDKNNHFSGQPIIKQVLSLIPKGLIARTAEEYQADRYYKTFTTHTHLVTMLFATLTRVSSLRELSVAFLACEGRINHLNLNQFPKRSTISDGNKNRSSKVFASIYYALHQKYAKFLSDSSSKQAPVDNLKIIDSSTISLFSDILTGVGRNPMNGKRKGGIKLHTMIDALEDVPSLVRFSSAATHDHMLLDALHLKPHSFVVMDKAYVDYQQFAKWTESSIYFVTRQKENAEYESVEEFDIPDEVHPGVIKDEHIHVLKDDEAICLRRVAFWDEANQKTYVFISNNFALSADKIADIYKQRWQIELMFKRLKQNFPLKYFLGDNRNAIEIQIWCGLIVQLLMKVIQQKTKKTWAFSNLVTMVRLHLMTYINLKRFLNNPYQNWEFLTTKPPQKQMDIFG